MTSRCAELMDAVLAEEAANEAWDREFVPSPHDPWRKCAELAALGAAAVPFLIESVDGGDLRRARWAVSALQDIGAAAGSQAAEALERHGHWCALFLVDEARARAVGAHRRHGVRSEIARSLYQTDRHRAARHLASLLDDPDPDLLVFALGGGGLRDGSEMHDIARRNPEAVAVDQVRPLLEHREAPVRNAAATLLWVLHLPEDAARVLAAIASRAVEVRCRYACWLATVPGSDALLDLPLDMQERFEVVRRRRCAGMVTRPQQVRMAVRDALRAPAAPRGLGHDQARTLAIGYAARIVEELRDRELARDLALAIGPVEGAPPCEGEGPFDELVPALASLGDAGRRAVDRALSAATGARRERLGWMRDELAGHVARPPRHTLALADDRFAAGNLEDPTLVDAAAHGAYAVVLLEHPRCAHAAFQIAWIDRAFGAPIARERLQWLRGLGADEDRLEALGSRPAQVMSGLRFGHRGDTYESDRVPTAIRAEQAGLPSIAARYWAAAGDHDHAAAARAAAAAHLDWVRRGCPTGGA